MNETILISAITSCVWTVGVLVAYMYRRIKKIVDENYKKVDDYMHDIRRHIDENSRVFHQAIDDVYRALDSRTDKLESRLEARLKDCACLTNSKQ